VRVTAVVDLLRFKLGPCMGRGGSAATALLVACRGRAVLHIVAGACISIPRQMVFCGLSGPRLRCHTCAMAGRLSGACVIGFNRDTPRRVGGGGVGGRGRAFADALWDAASNGTPGLVGRWRRFAVYRVCASRVGQK